MEEVSFVQLGHLFRIQRLVGIQTVHGSVFYGSARSMDLLHLLEKLVECEI